MYFLIGHRGVGKTSLLNRIRSYYKEESRNVQCIDLDTEIENRQGRTIADIFEKDGEEYFREMERFQLREIMNTFASYDGDVFVSLGAGFEVDEQLAKSGKFIWIRRETDKGGRVFLNRPRLNSDVSAFAEYRERFVNRDKKYRELCHETLTLQEGVEAPNEYEKEFFFPITQLKASCTLVSENFRSIESYIAKRKPWDLEFEIRDDLLSEIHIREALELKSRKLLSFRASPPNQTMLTAVVEKARVDWPTELQRSTKLNPTFISNHSNNLKEAISSSANKLAVKINSWSELLEGHKWWLDDKATRSFLPMSDDGRWNWYRLFVGSQSLVNFIREGDGSAVDQPTVLDWLSTRAFDSSFRENGFAAVLGDPVIHSRTPVEQREFFARYKMPVFAIRVTKEEWPQALPVLRELGLKAAAITAPLKELAFQICNETSELGRTFESVNTLILKQGKWLGENTDLGGFQKIAVNRKQSAVIWGGGGTLEVTRLLVPQAALYSAQTGEPRPGGKPFPPSGSPNNLIWSVGRTHFINGSAKWPPAHWRPQRVVDLNYTEDSPGLEYASQVGAEYISGLVMFKEQARLQREFWINHLSGR